MFKKRFNCVTFAFDLEDDNNIRIHNLDYHLSAEEAIAKFAQEFGMECRILEKETSPLKDGEWEIAFWGFIDNYDPDSYFQISLIPDYHLARKLPCGTWWHRKTWGAPIEQIDLEEKCKMFLEAGYPAKYFALKKKE